MKPAREPASSRSKPCASLKKPHESCQKPHESCQKPHESCPFAPPCFSRRKKKDRSQTSAFPTETSRFPFDSRAQGFSLPLARRRSSCPPPSPNLVPTHPIEHYQALRDSVPCLSRAATPPEGHQIGALKRRAPGNTILSQPNRRRVSNDRLNREGSQLAASLEGEPGPTPAGKTLPHSYPETRFRRERARSFFMILGRDPPSSCTLPSIHPSQVYAAPMFEPDLRPNKL